MRLISKTIIYYLLISILLLLLAGYFSCYQIDNTLSDESLLKESIQAEQLIVDFDNDQTIYLSYDSLSFIKPAVYESQLHFYSDTGIFDADEQEFLNNRILKNKIKMTDQYYLIVVLKSTLDKEDLRESLFLAFTLIICFLTSVFFVVNLILSKTLWKPFYKTLFMLTSYDVKKQHNKNLSLLKYLNSINCMWY
jgi:hypothetical protein